MQTSNHVRIIAVAIASLVPGAASGTPCDEAPCDPNWEIARPECYNDPVISCIARVTGTNYEDGMPMDPVWVGGTTCDACASQQGQQAQYSYSRTSGWSFCLTIGAGVSWEAPVGPNWEVTIETQLCYDTEETETVTATVNCGPGAKTGVRVLEIKTPSTVFVDVATKERYVYTRKDDAPDGCNDELGDTRVFELQCATETVSRSIVKHNYEVVFEDVPCIPDPPTPSVKVLEKVLSFVDIAGEEQNPAQPLPNRE